MTNNGTSGAPPPIDFNYQPPTYQVPRTVAQIRSVNGARPETTITVVGANSDSYIFGLTIIPIVLACVLIVWVILLVVTACWPRHQHYAPDALRTRRRLAIEVLAISLVISLIAWTTAFAYSIQAINVDAKVEENLDLVNDLLAGVRGRLGALTQSVYQSNATLHSISQQCSFPIPQIVDAFVQLQSTGEQLTVNSVETINGLNKTINDLSADVDSAIDTAKSSLFAKRIVIAVVSGIEMLLTLVALIYLVVEYVWRRDLGRDNTTSIYFHRCCNWRSLPRWFGVIGIILAIVLGALLHAVFLALADTCAQNVDINVNRLIGQVKNYPTLANYQGSSVQEMCSPESLNAGSEDTPMLVSALCYYQTCKSVGPFASSFLADAQGQFDTMQDWKQRIDQYQSVINFFAPVIDDQCEMSLSSLGSQAMTSIGNAMWLLYLTSCAQVNAVYTQTLYNYVCDQEVSNLYATFASWITAVVFMMVSTVTWLVLLRYYRASLDVKSPETAFLSDGGDPRSPLSAPGQAGSSYTSPAVHAVKNADQLAKLNMGQDVPRTPIPEATLA